MTVDIEMVKAHLATARLIRSCTAQPIDDSLHHTKFPLESLFRCVTRRPFGVKQSQNDHCRLSFRGLWDKGEAVTRYAGKFWRIVLWIGNQSFDFERPVISTR